LAAFFFAASRFWYTFFDIGRQVGERRGHVVALAVPENEFDARSTFGVMSLDPPARKGMRVRFPPRARR